MVIELVWITLARMESGEIHMDLKVRIGLSCCVYIHVPICVQFCADRVGK
jgi:hypothetical protein